MHHFGDVLPPKGRFSSIGVVESTGSTNNDLATRARTDGCEPTALIALEQTSGKGRRGRTWTQPHATGLSMSVLVPWGNHRSAFIVPTCLGLAVLDATEKLTQTGDRIALKWPNDLVACDSGAKVGGLLSEAIHASGDLVGLVCGIGVNLTWPMPGDVVDASLSNATCLSAVLEGAPALRDLAGTTLEAFDSWLSVVEQRGIEPALETYRARCATLGHQIEVRTEVDVVSGLAVDITNSGLLVVDTQNGQRSFSTGDVTRVRVS